MFAVLVLFLAIYLIIFFHLRSYVRADAWVICSKYGVWHMGGSLVSAHNGRMPTTYWASGVFLDSRSVCVYFGVESCLKSEDSDNAYVAKLNIILHIHFRVEYALLCRVMVAARSYSVDD